MPNELVRARPFRLVPKPKPLVLQRVLPLRPPMRRVPPQPLVPLFTVRKKQLVYVATRPKPVNVVAQVGENVCARWATPVRLFPRQQPLPRRVRNVLRERVVARVTRRLFRLKFASLLVPVRHVDGRVVVLAQQKRAPKKPPPFRQPHKKRQKLKVL